MLRRSLVGLAVGVLFAPLAWGQTAEELVARNLEAKGGLERLKSVQTLRMHGTMTVAPGQEAPFVMEMKRPNRMRLEVTVQGRTDVQAFDGETAWRARPPMPPQPVPAQALKGVQESADFDGPLVDYKAKGHTVEYVGKAEVDGTEAYKLKVTLKNGDVRHVFLDAKRFLEIRHEAHVKMGPSDVETESTIGDYRAVNGIMFAHRMESGPKDRAEKQRIIVEKIEVNPPIADDRFRLAR